MMDMFDEQALEIWSSTTSAVLAKGIVIDFARRIRAAALAEGGAREPVAFINEHDLLLLTGVDGVFATVRGVKDITHAFSLYAAPIAPPPAGLHDVSTFYEDAVPADGETPEGCTPADAQMLREANHALAIESDTRAKLLIEWLETELDASDEEYEPWVKSFAERANAATASYWDGATIQNAAGRKGEEGE